MQTTLNTLPGRRFHAGTASIQLSNPDPHGSGRPRLREAPQTRVRLWNELIISKSYYVCTNNLLTAMRNSSSPLKREAFFRNFGKISLRQARSEVLAVILLLMPLAAIA